MQQGAMVEPVAVGVRIGRVAGDVTGRQVLVIGAGPIGLLAVQALRGRGAAAVFCADLDPDRLAMARELGAEGIDPRTEDAVTRVREATDGIGVPVHSEWDRRRL
jgi:threonine dehydrogenase-like Zn-dependent dehydrogenase